MAFEVGQDIAFRTIWYEKISHARPFTVVHDSEDLIALYLQPGALIKTCVPQHSPKTAWLEPLLTKDWALHDAEWKWSHILMLHQPGRWSSIWGFWGPEDGDPLAWYVNLEEPWRRTKVGFDSRDLQLDIVLMPDDTWSWKDEVEFQEMIDLGLITIDEAQKCRDEGEAVVAELEAGDPWWHEWKGWRRDRSARIPVLPGGWDRLE